MNELPLQGRRIVVPESRELDLFARMLETQGAEAWRCPMVTIRDAEDPQPILAWIGRLAAGAFDDLILLTGEGLRRLLALAQRAGIEKDFVAGLGRLRTVTRGPKPVRALRELGLSPGLVADEPTTAGIIATLSRQDLAGHNIGVQLYPGNPNAALIDFLHRAGASSHPIVPYRYASDAETARVEAAIRDMADGKVDAIAFTSSPQVERLKLVAKERNLEAELSRGLARTHVAAVGPVVAAALEALAIRVVVMPAENFHLKPLVAALIAEFSRREERRP